VPTAMLGWLFVRDVWPGTPLWVLFVVAPVLVSAKIVVNWFVGWWWDRHEVFDREQTWGNKRDPIAKVLSKKLLDNEGIKGGF